MARPTVLIVEDDAAIRPHLAAILEEEGYGVLQAEHGARALALLESADPLPCLILLDLMMPVMDGWTFRERQLANPRIAAVPVVVLSGAADLAQDRPPLAARATLRKPFDLDRLLALMAEVSTAT